MLDRPNQRAPWPIDVGTAIERHRLNRLALLRRGAALAFAATPLASVLTACDGDHGADDQLTAGYLDWILRLHPAIAQDVGPAYAEDHRIPAVHRGGASASKLVRDARAGRSDSDIYVGMTPFLEMADLVEAEAIVPWDEYAPAAVVKDLHPALRRENTLGGKLYGWPFLLDVTVQAWSIELVERAGLDPGRPPATWDEYLDNARAVQETGAAPYGCTFDARLWRSLVPITYAFSTDVYTDEGLFDYTHEAVVNALEVMRRMVELANPDVLDPTTTAGSGSTTDEGAFASQLAGYYIKYTNAPIRAANTWPDPSRLALSSVPRSGAEGATLFWTTGIALARHGANRRAAAQYAEALTFDNVLWRNSMGTGRQSVGQIPGFRSLWATWRSEQPPWVPEWAVRAFQELDDGAPIKPHRLGTRQFTIAQPYVEQYLRGEESNARRLLAQAQAAVRKAAA